MDGRRQSFTTGLGKWFLKYIHYLDTGSYFHQIIDLYLGDSKIFGLEPALLNSHGKRGLIMVTCGMAMTVTSHFFHVVSLIEQYAPMTLQNTHVSIIFICSGLFDYIVGFTAPGVSPHMIMTAINMAVKSIHFYG